MFCEVEVKRSGCSDTGHVIILEEGKQKQTVLPTGVH